MTMRLIHTTTREICQFPANRIPPYAILSHTWDDTEPSFQDVSRSGVVEGSKIDKCCIQAVLDGWQYVWIDNCCINKESSTELSEAINSMFKWYKESAICYIYMKDVYHQNRFDFSTARWFERGWTLQELLAPSAIMFFDREWIEIGTKWRLREELTRATRISEKHLWDPTGASIAVGMSWASRRKTTLPEDRAYSMMGLFDVNMPLIYGEGEVAFMRLQEQIVQNIPDDSIFAWNSGRFEGGGILAKSPNLFEEPGDIVPVRPRAVQRAPYSITNQGLAIEVACRTPLFDESKKSPEASQIEFGILQLNCRRHSEPDKCLAIKLVKIGDVFFRNEELFVVDKRPLESLKTVYIMKHFDIEKNILADQKNTQRFAVRLRPAFARRFQWTLMSVELTVDGPKLLGRIKSRKIDQSTLVIEDVQTVFLTCTERYHGDEALGVVIWPQYEIPYIDTFVINDITKATEALRQRTMHIMSQYQTGRRVPAPDIYSEILSSGTRISVELRRANIDNDVYNLVLLDIE